MPATRVARIPDAAAVVVMTAAALAMSQKLPPSVRHSQQLHAFDYLEYAYLQEARDKDARAVVDDGRAAGGVGRRGRPP